MVSEREGHTSGVRDLFFQAHLSNSELQLVVQRFLLVKECFQKSSLSLMHISVTFSWGISLGLPDIISVIKKKRTKHVANREHSYTSGEAVHSWHDWCSKVVFFSELWFRAPTKTEFWVLRSGREREAPGWRGGLRQWLTTEWSIPLEAEARRHDITGREKTPPPQLYCFLISQRLHISMWKAWLTK